MLPRTASAVRLLWCEKHGNAPDEWEDAADCSSSGDLGVVCDGASEGIFTRLWANLLAARYAEERPGLADLKEWLSGCRSAWMTAINFPALRWSQQPKVLDVGAAATLLTLRLGSEDGGVVPWQVLAVGDSCLFWVRANRLLASFPLVHSTQFGPAPDLLRTRPNTPMPVPLLARGVCRAGDLFLLATDAVATMLLRLCEEGTPPPWERLAVAEEEAWREEVAHARTAGLMVNDDCTLLCMRVAANPGSGP